MSSDPSVFAACFDDPEHSDVLLHAYVDADPADQEPAQREPPAKRARADSGGTSSAALPAIARSYHCHAIILSMLSTYFKAALSTTWQQPSSSDGSSSSKRPVEIHVGAEELAALHELLRMLYSQALPAIPPTAPLFLQCLKLADRIGSVSCMELLLGGLAALPSGDIDCTLLSYVFQAPPGVCVSRSYTALLETCSKALVQLFGDVPAVIKDEALLQQFCSLPHAAVLAWVRSDELQVHSENCVVFLVSGWVQANQDSTAAQHEELAHEIPVFHLGPAYQHHILPALSWFKDCSAMEYLPAVLHCIRAGIKMTEGLEAEKNKMWIGALVWPRGWLSKPRKYSNSSRSVSSVVGPSQLQVLNEGRLVRLPFSLYVNGFMLKMEIKQAGASSSAATPATSKTLGAYVGVYGRAMGRRGVPIPAKTMVHFETVSLKVGSSGSEKSKERNMLRNLIFPAVATTGGSNNILTGAASTIMQLLAPYLEQGQLHIDTTFSGIDT